MSVLKKLFFIIMMLAMPVVSFAGVKTILVLGDSLSAGYGLQPQQVWVVLLQDKLKENYQVINAGVNGDTTAGGLARLPQALAKYRPDLVLIELGGNDGLRGLPLNTIRNNLISMIQQVKNANAKPVLLGVRLPPSLGLAYTRDFTQIYLDLAKQENIPVVPLLLNGIDTDFDLMQADRIHPVAKAEPQILNTVWQVLEPVLNNS